MKLGTVGKLISCLSQCRKSGYIKGFLMCKEVYCPPVLQPGCWCDSSIFFSTRVKTEDI